MKAEDNVQTKNYVEILDNGNILFSGKLISASEFAAGAALCGLKQTSTERFDEDDGRRESDDGNLSDITADGKDDKEGSKKKPAAAAAAATAAAAAAASKEKAAAPKKRRRGDRPHELPADDIRVGYPRRYFAALNSGDGQVIAQMLKEIAIPKVVLVTKVLKNQQLPHLEVVGCDAIASVCESFYTASPDMAALLTSEKFSVYGNGESSIACVVEMKGSMLYELDGLPETGAPEGQKVILTTGVTVNAPEDAPIRGQDSVMQNTKVVVNVESSLDNSTPAGMVRDAAFGVGAYAKKKVDFSFTVHLTFHLNAQKKVFLIISENV